MAKANQGQAPRQDVAVINAEIVCNTLISADYQAQLKQVLPPGLSVDRFTRTTLMAVQNNPDAVRGADKMSFYNAVVKCASDGLIPDGREAALVAFNVNIAEPGQPRQMVKRIQYMPMIGGIVKICGEHGIHLDSQVVYANDHFQVQYGDEPRIQHAPPKFGVDRGEPVGAYAIATFKNGYKQRELMSYGEIEQVRAVSRSSDKGPWVDWWEEMARKTVTKRLIKHTAMPEKVKDVGEADNSYYELPPIREPGPTASNAPVDLRPSAEIAADPVNRPRVLQNILDQESQQTGVAGGVSSEPQPTGTAEPAGDIEGEII